MKLTTRGCYALQALADIVNNSRGRPVRLIDISTRQELPLRYLEQIFRNLRRGDIVRSVRGPGGGMSLSRPPAEITIAQVLSSVNESLRYSDDVEQPSKPTPEYRQINRYLKALDVVVIAELSKTTLESLIGLDKE